MPRSIRVFHLCAGDCGACAAEVWAAVEGAPQLAWAFTPQQADVVVLTGSIPPSSRGAMLATYTSLIAGQVPVVVVGRCAIDGHPFGKGGIAALPDIEARRKVDGCPPLVEVVVDALLDAGRQPRLIEQ